MGMFPDWDTIYAKFDILKTHLETLTGEVKASRKTVKENTEAVVASTAQMKDLAAALRDR